MEKMKKIFKGYSYESLSSLTKWRAWKNEILVPDYFFVGACQANDSLLTSILEADFGAFLFYSLTCCCDDRMEIGFDEGCFG
eukprot:15326601-Ditylum_brightwellii.AAC.1